jgi:hypothetical protein
MPWSSRTSCSMGLVQLWMRPPACGASERSVALSRASTAAPSRRTRVGAGGARRARATRAIASTSERTSKKSLGVVGVGEAQRVAELAHAVLHLDARVHLHEEVAAAPRRCTRRSRPSRGPRRGRSARPLLHASQRGEVGARGLRPPRSRPAARAAAIARRSPSCVTTPPGASARASAASSRARRARRTTAVAEELDLVVPRLFDVELEEDVLVVADAPAFTSRGSRAPRPAPPSLARGLLALAACRSMPARMRWPLPPPPPMALRRTRWPGCASRSSGRALDLLASSSMV